MIIAQRIQRLGLQVWTLVPYQNTLCFHLSTPLMLKIRLQNGNQMFSYLIFQILNNAGITE